MGLATSLLSNESAIGGLSGLITKFQSAGLGDVIASWISTGANLPVSAAQIEQVLGSDVVQQIAAKMGLAPADASTQLSQALPTLVDKLSPGGTVPAEGLGQLEDTVTELLGGLGGNLGGTLGSLGSLLGGKS